MKNDISLVASVTDLDTGKVLTSKRRRVDPNIGVIRISQDILNDVSFYLGRGYSVHLEINFIRSGFSDRNNQQLSIF